MFLGCAIKKVDLLYMYMYLNYYFQSFAVDMMSDDIHEVKEDKIKELVIKAGGANYGPGK